MPEEETIESLTSVVRELMDMMATHAVMLGAVMRSLDEAGIPVKGFMHRPVH